jgi:hypothetical protein
MVGSWLIGGTLAAGTVAGMMSRGRLGKMGRGGNAVGRMTRQRIKFLNKTPLTDKDTDRLITILKRAKTGKLSQDDRTWLRKKVVSYKNKARNSLPFMKDHKSKSRNPNPSPKGEQPVATNTPETQPTQNIGDPKRGNPNITAMSEPHKEVLSKLKQGGRLTKEDYLLLRQLKNEGKLTKTQQTLLTARRRLNTSKRIEQRKTAGGGRQTAANRPEREGRSTVRPEGEGKNTAASGVPNPPSPVAAPKVEAVGKHSENALKSILSKGGTLPDNIPAYPDAVRQLRIKCKTPDLMLKKERDYTEQLEEFACAIAEVAKDAPLPDQENVCLLLSHKITQANRPIKNFGESLYGKAIAILNAGRTIKKKVIP